MIRPIISATALFLALAVGSAAQAQSNPLPCAYNQFPAAERVTLGKQIIAAQKSANRQAVEDLEKKVTASIGAKIGSCPNARAFTDQQKSMVLAYALTSFMRDGANANFPAIDGKPLTDAFWSELPPDVRQTLTAAATAADKDQSQAMLDKFFAGPYIAQFQTAHGLHADSKPFLTAAVTTAMFLIALDANWNTGA